MGGPQGLDYQAVEALMRIRRTRNRADVMDRLMLMEQTFLEERND